MVTSTTQVEEVTPKGRNGKAKNGGADGADTYDPP